MEVNQNMDHQHSMIHLMVLEKNQERKKPQFMIAKTKLFEKYFELYLIINF